MSEFYCRQIYLRKLIKILKTTWEKKNLKAGSGKEIIRAKIKELRIIGEYHIHLHANTL